MRDKEITMSRIERMYYQGMCLFENLYLNHRLSEDIWQGTDELGDTEGPYVAHNFTEC